jgi:hypothetical protein
MFVERIRVGGGRRLAVTKRWSLAWLLAVLAAFLVAPSVASAAWVLSGRTNQGFSIRLRVSNNLRKVKQITILWRAKCGISGGTLTDGTTVRLIVIRPFPNFQSTGDYATSVAQPNGQIDRVAIAGQLYGKLMLNIRARGTWSVQAVIRDPSGNRIAGCSTGVIRWTAHG